MDPLPPYSPGPKPPAYRPPSHRTNVLQADTGSWYTVSDDGDDVRLRQLSFDPPRRAPLAHEAAPQSLWRSLWRYLCLTV